MRSRVLDSNNLLTRAKRDAFLYDFGEGSFREGLDVLVDALNSEADLTWFARRRLREVLVATLVQRLQIRDRVKKSQPANISPTVIIGPAPGGGSERLLMPTFQSAAFTNRARVPSYSHWLLECDMTPAYEFLLVQGTTNLDFDSTTHMAHIDQLLAVYPEAVFSWGCRLPM